MTDRTMIAVGRSSFSVPRLLKRALEVAIATALTALMSLMVLLTNAMLTAKGGYAQGFDMWLQFIRRSDILGTIVLTGIVTVSYLIWQRRQDKR